MQEVLIGFAGSLLIAGTAYARKALSLSGLFAAVLMGTWMYSLVSIQWFGLLIAFFISSSLLSYMKRTVKSEAEGSYAKSGTRDAGQVFANGGLALGLCLMSVLIPSPLWWYAFVGSLAAVTADTWATEIGAMSRRQPISIVTGRRVAPGTSGGVSLLGLTAAAGGGIWIGGIAFLLSRLSGDTADLAWIGIALVSGWIGALADSWMGAVLQRMYRCKTCGRTVEIAVHCGETAQRIGGVSWINNDIVNFLCSVCGAGIAVILAILLN